MKPRIVIFGLPPSSSGKISIWIYKNPIDGNFGELVFESQNNESGILFEYSHSEIEIGDVITFVIMSLGVNYYKHRTTYKGTDISLVPNLVKERNVSEEDVAEEWNFEKWKIWKPDECFKMGLELEKSYILSKKISVAPIWESYYAESKIDYLEKFHKLWIGLNSFASQFSNETGDKNKILALVNSDLQKDFNSKIGSLSNLESEQKLRRLQQATGINMTSQIVRDEINKSLSVIDFLELSKNASGLFSDIATELEGLVFLDKNGGKETFQNIFLHYHEYMASEQGILEEYNIAQAFESPYSPESVIRIGRLVYHNPFNLNTAGTLFNLEDFFGVRYAAQPYNGQAIAKIREWEMADPLFFKYLLVLYKFRSAYFHGELPPNSQNDELAKAAYLSLYELFPSIL